ncbi:hypothetical protein Plhal304r1_c027g0089861 [Plasmopara halstedii]
MELTIATRQRVMAARKRPMESRVASVQILLLACDIEKRRFNCDSIPLVMGCLHRRISVETHGRFLLVIKFFN